MNWNIPNILTVFRLLAAPAIPLAYMLFSSPLADWIALVLFISASLTDYLDGYLARKFNQISKFGKMLDPIADKVMVALALVVMVALSAGNLMVVWIWQDFLVMICVTIILFREIFVSGLREFLGADAGKLEVTRLAKWKTTIQMFAISTMIIGHMFQFYVAGGMFGMEQEYARAVVFGEIVDDSNLRLNYLIFQFTTYAGLALLSFAALLTMVTGWDYFKKAMPYLREDK